MTACTFKRIVKAGNTNCWHRKKRQRKTTLRTVLLVPKLQEFTFFTLWILHLVYLPKFCITIVFAFSWDNCDTQEKWKTMVKQFILGKGGWGRRVHKEYYKQCENSECHILLCCLQQHFCYEWKAKSDTLKDFKSFIHTNINLLIPNWYLISWAFNFAKLKTSKNKSSRNWKACKI